MTNVVMIMLLLLLPFSPAAADEHPILELGNEQSVFAGSSHAYFLEDPSRELTLSDILSENHAGQFLANEKPVLNFGRSQSAWWVKLRVVDRSSQKWYLLLNAILGEDFDLYVLPVSGPENAPVAEADLVTTQYFNRLEDFRRYAWSLELPQNQPLDLYMRVTNGNSIVIVPIEFVNSDVILASSNDDYRLYGAVYIGMLVLAVYQFFMFIILREGTYLALTTNAIGMLITTHNSNPVFESLKFLGDTGGYFFITPLLISIISTMIFTRSIVGIDKAMPWINGSFNLVIAFAVVLIMVVGAVPGSSIIVLLLGMFMLVQIAIVSLYVAIKNRSGIAAYFLLIFLVPLSVHVINLSQIVFNTDGHQASNDTYGAIVTLVFMLLLAVIHAQKVRLERDKMREIEVLAKIKDDFLAIMSHELRTPMNAIVGLGALLKLSDLNKTQTVYVEKLGLASRYMMQLISNVLDFTKVKNHSFELEKQAFRLDIALRSVSSMLSQTAEQKDLSLTLDSDDLLPTNIIGDRGHLSQVLINLLVNSIKYTEEGSIRLLVKTLPSDSANQLRIEFNVIDTGIGISKEDQQYLFDPYRQVKGANGLTREGVGLGLAISKSLVEQMGGNLRLESKLGKGSRFYFELTFEITNELVAPELEACELSDFLLPKGLQVLLTDDSLLNRFVGTEMIQNMGAEVSVAPTGESAIVQLQQQTFDVVLMDINLPGKDGLEITRWIRQHALDPTVPVIALTAHDLSNVKRQCEAAGMDGFLSKPFEYQDLYRAIMSVLERQNPKLLG